MSVINWLNKPDFKNGHVCEFIEGPFRKKKGLVVQSGFREGPRSGIMFQRVKVAGFRSLVETPQAHTRILHMVQWKVRETPPPMSCTHTVQDVCDAAKTAAKRQREPKAQQPRKKVSSDDEYYTTNHIWRRLLWCFQMYTSSA